ncbi:MAG: IS21 family transposase, partial [Euzebya sp.]
MYREVGVIEIREVLRLWLRRDMGLRPIGELVGVDRKTVRRYVEAAVGLGLDRAGGLDQLTDELIGGVVEAVRPDRPRGHGLAWEACTASHDDIKGWLDGDVPVAKIETLLARRGTTVPYRTLHRYCVQELGFGAGRVTVPVADGEPGKELQIDFGRLGMITDAESGRRRVLQALVLTAVVSRHTFVWCTFTQTTEAVIAGLEAAWAFFGGIFAVVVPDNMRAIIDQADATNPRVNRTMMEYAQARGFVIDPARVRKPQDKPRVERAVQYVQGNFFAGEDFGSVADAQTAAERWCGEVAGRRIHGTTRLRPAEHFVAIEKSVLLPAPEEPYDVPVWSTPKVHRDHHVQVGKSLYSVPGGLIGQIIDARRDRRLVKLWHRGTVIKVHPALPPGRRSTDPDDLPSEQTAYAMRDLDQLIGHAAKHGTSVEVYARRLLDSPLPWTRMRTVYRLIGLAKRHGSTPVDT